MGKLLRIIVLQKDAFPASAVASTPLCVCVCVCVCVRRHLSHTHTHTHTHSCVVPLRLCVRMCVEHVHFLLRLLAEHWGVGSHLSGEPWVNLRKPWGPREKVSVLVIHFLSLIWTIYSASPFSAAKKVHERCTLGFKHLLKKSCYWNLYLFFSSWLSEMFSQIEKKNEGI